MESRGCPSAGRPARRRLRTRLPPGGASPDGCEDPTGHRHHHHESGADRRPLFPPEAEDGSRRAAGRTAQAGAQLRAGGVRLREAEKSNHYNTVMLECMARFVITDMSDAKSVLQELQAIVPSGPKLPVQPIIVAAQEEPGMFNSFEAYPWFLKVHRYDAPAPGRAARSIRRAGHPPRRGQASGALGVGGSSPLNRRGAKASVLPQRRLDPGSFPCSSRPPSKPSPPFPGPRKSPTAAGIRALGLGVRRRNVTVNCSPNAHSSPERWLPQTLADTAPTPRMPPLE